MRIIFIGTSSFGVPILRKLISLLENVVAVITQPDRPAGRGKRVKASPIKELASQFGLYLFQPENINADDAIEEIAGLKPDLIILVAYGQILSGKILSIPVYGCLNIHPSLLPKYKGPAPIHWTLIKGEEETGISFLFMNEKIDAGDIICQKKIKILPEENFEQLEERLAEESAEMLEQVLSMIKKGEYQLTPQPKEKCFYARKLTKSDCRIDWGRTGREIFNLTRGLTYLPGAYTEFKGRRIKITKVNLLEKSVAEHNLIQQKPGTIIKVEKEGIQVLTGDNTIIVIKRLVPSGAKEMDVLEFINGYHPQIGDEFN
ncbi:MAG: methionyl-tRNA formyltransferase [Candidatus Caldatribacteriota bacterium]|nr:methionyl-tRNA formyltransferase [Candidatus Atribacteria bacterium]MDD3539203.1 methionyl-tRNA formyltransferase [Atribacterota bacterium]